MNNTSRRQRDGGSFPAILIITLQFVLASAGGFSLLMLALGSPGCSAACDYGAYSRAVTAFFVVAVVLVLASIAGVVWMGRKSPARPWVPTASTALMVVTWIIALSLATQALAPR